MGIIVESVRVLSGMKAQGNGASELSKTKNGDCYEVPKGVLCGIHFFLGRVVERSLIASLTSEGSGVKHSPRW